MRPRQRGGGHRDPAAARSERPVGAGMSRARKVSRRQRADAPETGRIVDMALEMRTHHETSPRLTGGDVDADWQNASAAGDEAVGGSTSTPDQDIVDEIGEALGVPQAPDAELRTSGEILAERDRRRWQLEREAAGEERQP
jgi:Family of unknown function (DUF6335)